MEDIRLSDYSKVDEDKVDICRSLQDSIYNSEHSVIDLLGQKIDNPTIFKWWNGECWTDRYVGVLNYTNSEHTYKIVIASRFDDNNKQYFLQYLFKKCFDEYGRIFDDMSIKGNPDETWDLLLAIMFLNRFRAALRKGMYRQYRRFEYNDSRVKGSIDIARHIRQNPLSNGKIAYSTRENTVDNYYNALFLRAYSMMSKKYPDMMKKMMSDDKNLLGTFRSLEQKVHCWESMRVQTLMKETDRKIVHPVYKKYEEVRQTSHIILKRLGIDQFEKNKVSVSGVVIDMSKLWERYLKNSVLKDGWDTQNQYIVLNRARIFKPDFYNEGRKMVLDAKYRAAWQETHGEKEQWNDRTRDDIFQIFAYMLSLECNLGGVIYPYNTDENFDFEKPRSVFHLGISGSKNFIRCPLKIPKYKNDDEFSKFTKYMEENEKKCKEYIENR